MKVSYVGIVALVMAGLLALALWPEGIHLAGPPAAMAQVAGGQAAATVGALPADGALDRSVVARRNIQAALDQDVEFQFVDTPLAEVVEYIGKTSGIPVILRKGALADASIPEDLPVTSSLQGISLRSALRLLLEDLKLSYVISDEVLQITTREEAEMRMNTRVYDCRELIALSDPAVASGERRAAPRHGQSGGFGGIEVAPGDAGGTPALAPIPAGNSPPGASPPAGAGLGSAGMSGGFCGSIHHVDATYHRLIDVITTTVDPDTWSDVGGPGTIAEYKGLLAISQTGEVHEKVERLLNMLHTAAGLKEQRVKVVE